MNALISKNSQDFWKIQKQNYRQLTKVFKPFKKTNFKIWNRWSTCPLCGLCYIKSDRLKFAHLMTVHSSLQELCCGYLFSTLFVKRKWNEVYKTTWNVVLHSGTNEELLKVAMPNKDTHYKQSDFVNSRLRGRFGVNKAKKHIVARAF